MCSWLLRLTWVASSNSTQKVTLKARDTLPGFMGISSIFFEKEVTWLKGSVKAALSRFQIQCSHFTMGWKKVWKEVTSWSILINKQDLIPLLDFENVLRLGLIHALRMIGFWFPANLQATAKDSEMPLVCVCQSDLPKLCLRAAPRAWPLILQSKPSIAFWNSLRE